MSKLCTEVVAWEPKSWIDSVKPCLRSLLPIRVIILYFGLHSPSIQYYLVVSRDLFWPEKLQKGLSSKCTVPYTLSWPTFEGHFEWYVLGERVSHFPEQFLSIQSKVNLASKALNRVNLPEYLEYCREILSEYCQYSPVEPWSIDVFRWSDRWSQLDCSSLLIRLVWQRRRESPNLVVHSRSWSRHYNWLLWLFLSTEVYISLIDFP